MRYGSTTTTSWLFYQVVEIYDTHQEKFILCYDNCYRSVGSYALKYLKNCCSFRDKAFLVIMICSSLRAMGNSLSGWTSNFRKKKNFRSLCVGWICTSQFFEIQKAVKKIIFPEHLKIKLENPWNWRIP